MESLGSNTGTEVKTVVEVILRLDDTIKTKVASTDMSVYVVPHGTREEGERRIVVGTVRIELFRRSGNVKKVLRKPEVVPEQDLVESE